jgi:hypothetical protein
MNNELVPIHMGETRPHGPYKEAAIGDHKEAERIYEFSGNLGDRVSVSGLRSVRLKLGTSLPPQSFRCILLPLPMRPVNLFDPAHVLVHPHQDRHLVEIHAPSLRTPDSRNQTHICH